MEEKLTLEQTLTNVGNNVLQAVRTFLQQEMGNRITENNGGMLEIKIAQLLQQELSNAIKTITDQEAPAPMEVAK